MADSTPIVPFGGLHGSGNDKTQFERIVDLERELAARDAELALAKRTIEMLRTPNCRYPHGYCLNRDEIKQLERERDEARRAAERIWAAAVEVIDAERKWSYSQPTIQALRELEAAIAAKGGA